MPPSETSSPRLLLIGDVAGSGHYHLGDEAMLEANLRRLRQLIPGVGCTVVSADPDWTRRHYGVDAVRTPVGASDTGRWGDWLGTEVSGALARADGLVVSGGGNMCATWPEKVLERVALIEHARELGRPAVIVGQTIGPDLTDVQRSLISRAFSGAAYIGLREEPSFDLARAIGVDADRLDRQLDDAFFLEPMAVDDDRGRPFRAGERRSILVTLDASFGHVERAPLTEALARQLDALADAIDAALVFVPHVGGSDVCDALADAVAGRALAARLRSPLLVLDVWQAREARWLVEQAAMVCSTRYHALVFAASAGVPALGIYGDAYTRVKLCGALAPAGLDHYCLPLDVAVGGGVLPLGLELWRERGSVRERLTRLRADGWRRERERWKMICGALGVVATALPDRPSGGPHTSMWHEVPSP